jgi:hypothetical protein
MPRNELFVVSPTDPGPQWPDGYVSVLREAGAQEKNIPYCIGRVRRFFARFPGRHRRDLGRADTETFLSETAAHPGVCSWQIQQARDALELYYVKFRGIALEPREFAPANSHEPSPTRSSQPVDTEQQTASGKMSAGIQNTGTEYTKSSVSVKAESTINAEPLNAERSTHNAQGEREAKACIKCAAVVFTAAALMLSGCLSGRVIEDTSTPEIEIDRFGAIAVMGQRVERANLAVAVRKAGFKQGQEINILIPKTTDRQLMASIAGELRRNGFTRVVFVSDKKTYSELAK